VDDIIDELIAAETAIDDLEYKKECDIYTSLSLRVPFDSLRIHTYTLALELLHLENLTNHIRLFPDNEDAKWRRAQWQLRMRAKHVLEETIDDLLSETPPLCPFTARVLRQFRVEAASQWSQFRNYLVADIEFLWEALGPLHYSPQPRWDTIRSILKIADPAYEGAIHTIANSEWMDPIYKPILLRHVANLQELERLKQTFGK
jgi:hypothetical protein